MERVVQEVLPVPALSWFCLPSERARHISEQALVAPGPPTPTAFQPHLCSSPILPLAARLVCLTAASGTTCVITARVTPGPHPRSQFALDSANSYSAFKTHVKWPLLRILRGSARHMYLILTPHSPNTLSTTLLNL